MDKQAQVTVQIISLRDGLGGETYTDTHSLAENEKAIVSTSLSAKREIFSNKFFIILFFCTLFLLGVVMWQAVRTGKWSRVASSQSESEKAYPGLENRQLPRLLIREFI